MDAGIPSTPNSIDNSSSSLPNKKRRVGSSGRGVASLTPEQLAKKRANDREAQRAIRERTKNQIETLERKIEDLTSQQPYQELQAIIRQKDVLQAENDEIRRRLASILSIIQPIVGAQGLTDLATAAQHNVQMGFGQQNPNLFQQTDQYLNSPQHNGRSYSAQSGAPTDTNFPAHYSPIDQDGTQENRVWSSSRDALNQQRDNLNKGLELNESGERLSFNFLLDSVNQNQKGMHMSNVATTHTRSMSPIGHQQHHTHHQSQQQHHSHHQQQQQRAPHPPLYPYPNFLPDQLQPVWATLPKNSTPTCPLDTILLNFFQARQREAQQHPNNSSNNTNQVNTNTNTTTASSPMSQGPMAPPPAYPSVSSLLNPTSTARIDPLSQLMTDIISKFPNISALPEQVATLFFMFLFMRWQIHPTQENYDRLPEWLTPRPSQLFTSHPAWIDHLPWPRMRDKLVNNFDQYPFENWFFPFTAGMSVNWPYEDVDCLLTSTSSGGETTMNPVFERHIRRLENWSLGREFATVYPDMADMAIIKEKSNGVGGGVINNGVGESPHIGGGVVLRDQVQSTPGTGQNQNSVGGGR